MFVNIFGEKRERERERENDAAMGEQGERKFLSFSVCVCVFKRNTYLRYPYWLYVVSKSSSACIQSITITVPLASRLGFLIRFLWLLNLCVTTVVVFAVVVVLNKRKNKRKQREQQEKNKR